MLNSDSGRKVAGVLERALNERLGVDSHRSTNQHEIPPKIKVFDFQPLTQQLFAGRRFSEYRFGVSAHNPHHPSRTLGALLERFSRVLGSYKVPIAYLYFPDYFNESDTSGLAWLRIGVGAATRPLDSLEVDLIANTLAREHNCRYLKYDPFLPGPAMGARFREIDDHRLDRSAATLASGEQLHAKLPATDLVFAEGPARTGYVADMLAECNEFDLLGGTMTVLAGHTVSCWQVRSGAGERFAEAIRSMNARAIKPGNSRVFTGTTSAPKDRRSDPRDRAFWLAWRCSDAKGVQHRIVSHLLEFARVKCQGSAESIDIKYAISRVLDNGRTCAGKISFLVTGEAAEGFARKLPELQLQVTAVISPAISGWKPRFQEWIDTPVLVSDDEPAEDPWGSLVVES